MKEGPEELETALRSLERLAQEPRKRRPDRYDARAVLVPLGLRLLEGGERGLEEVLERLRGAAERLGTSWEAAVRDELSLAAAEHVHAVDHRYLELPNYDFAYTVRARRRLEARIVAAEALDVELPESLAEGVRQADARLAPFLASRPEGADLDHPRS